MKTKTKKNKLMWLLFIKNLVEQKIYANEHRATFLSNV